MRELREVLKQVPNFLTTLRILFAVLFPFLPFSRRSMIIIGALLTEYLDGATSRWLHAQTQLGQLLDPIADKLFFGSVAVTLVAEERLSPVELLLLWIRDIGVVLGAGILVVAENQKELAYEMKPRIFGKLTTALQYGALLNLTFRHRLNPALLAVTAVSGTLAVFQYSQQVRVARNSIEFSSLRTSKKKIAATA